MTPHRPAAARAASPVVALYWREKAKRDRRNAKLIEQARQEYEAALTATAPRNAQGRRRAHGIAVEGATLLRHPVATTTPKPKKAPAAPRKPRGGRAPLALPPRPCERCGRTMQRKRLARGAWESPSKFRARRFCCRACSDAALTHRHDAEILRRWQAGESCPVIAAALGLTRARVHQLLQRARATTPAQQVAA